MQYEALSIAVNAKQSPHRGREDLRKRRYGSKEKCQAYYGQNM